MTSLPDRLSYRLRACLASLHKCISQLHVVNPYTYTYVYVCVCVCITQVLFLWLTTDLPTFSLKEKKETKKNLPCFRQETELINYGCLCGGDLWH